jgi:hypothetical protein
LQNFKDVTKILQNFKDIMTAETLQEKKITNKNSFFLSDSYVLGSRLALSLDDLLWVLTDSQLTAALHFLDSLSGLVQQANELSRRIKAKRKLEVSRT